MLALPAIVSAVAALRFDQGRKLKSPVVVEGHTIFAGNHAGFVRFTSPRIVAGAARGVEPAALGAVLKASKAATLTAGAISGLSQVEDTASISIPPSGIILAQGDLATLRDAIGHTLQATAKDNTRYSIAGVFFRGAADGKSLQLVSTDGHRLHTATPAHSVADQEAFTKSAGVIIDKDHLSAFFKLTKGDTGAFTIRKSDHANTVWLCATLGRGESVEMLAQTIEGNFPPVDDVIPKLARNSLSLTFDRAALISAVKIAAAATDEDSRGVLICAKGGQVRVAAKSDAGQAISPAFAGIMAGILPESMAREVDGTRTRELTADYAHTFALSPRYILEALATHAGESVTLHLSAHNHPALIVDQDGAQSVIMPVHIEAPRRAELEAAAWATVDAVPAEVRQSSKAERVELTSGEALTVAGAIVILRKCGLTKGRSAAIRELLAVQ